MITPTVGRIVWYMPYVPGTHTEGEPDYDRNMPHDGKEPLPAIVTLIQKDRTINVTVFDSMGGLHGRQAVKLVQDGEAYPDDSAYCEWMPYQKQVASGQREPVKHAESKVKE